jgi:tetratricopeptide (TPR) repeat protein
VLEDGTPPPDPVGIERVCNGVVRPEGYTDSKGRFSIQIGQNSLAFTDASVGSNNVTRGFGSSSGAAPGPNSAGGISERDLADCDLRASLGGYRSDEVSLAGRRALDGPNVGTLILHRYAHGEGDTVSFTSLSAPKEAAKALQRGREAARKEKWDEARKQFEKAVQIHPQYASAWCELGRTLEYLQDEAGAWNAYQRAIASDERFIPPYIQLETIELKRRDWAGAIETADRILKLDSVNFPGVYIFRSIAQFSSQDLGGAEKSVRQALDLDTAHRFPEANHVLGVILAQLGDLSGAAAHLRAYLRLAPNASDASFAKAQLARIEQLARSTPPGTP